VAWEKAWEKTKNWFAPRKTETAHQLPLHPVCFICREKILDKPKLRGIEEPGHIRLYAHADCMNPLQLWGIMWRYFEARTDSVFVASQYGEAP